MYLYSLIIISHAPIYCIYPLCLYCILYNIYCIAIQYTSSAPQFYLQHLLFSILQPSVSSSAFSHMDALSIYFSVSFPLPYPIQNVHPCILISLAPLCVSSVIPSVICILSNIYSSVSFTAVHHLRVHIYIYSLLFCILLFICNTCFFL